MSGIFQQVLDKLNGAAKDSTLTDGSLRLGGSVDTELPAAAALSDSTANPTAPMVGAAAMVWDQYAGTWKRVKSSASADGSDGTDSVAVGPQLYRSGVWEQQRAVGGDAQAATGLVAGSPVLYNGSSFDRQRGNTEGTLLASAARTTQTTSSVQTSHNARGVRVSIFVTAKAAATTLSVYIPGVRSYGNDYVAVLSAPWAADVSKILVFDVYPGITPAAMTAGGGGAVDKCMALSQLLPRSWMLEIYPSDANSVTYEAYYSLLV